MTEATVTSWTNIKKNIYIIGRYMSSNIIWKVYFDIYMMRDTIVLSKVNQSHDVNFLNMMQYDNYTV